jgi:hypothetical protein
MSIQNSIQALINIRLFSELAPFTQISHPILLTFYLALVLVKVDLAMSLPAKMILSLTLVNS